MNLIADPLFYLAALPAVIFLGLAKGGFAGFGTLATPLLALVMPPLQAAALLLPILMCQDAISVWVYRHDWDAWNVRVMLPGAVIGMGIGWLFAAHVSDAHVRLVVGGIGLLFVLQAWLRAAPKRPRRATAASGIFWGAVSGFTSFMTQGGGPPFQVHVLPQRLPKMTLVGTTTIYFAAVNAMKVMPYFALGQFTPTNFATSVVLLPLAIATNFLGIWLVRRTPTEVFYKIAYVLVLAVSLGLIWQGVADLLQPSP